MISIIGAGRIGTSVALDLIKRNIDDLLFMDIIEGLPQGEALDLGHMASSYGIDIQLKGTNDYKEITGSDIIIVTAGLPRKPGMTRLDLLQKNSQIISNISRKISKYAPDSIILMVTNPLDLMTYLALNITGFNSNRVIGMGGLLDSARFRYFIAKRLNISRSSINALVIGEHGENMLPLPKYTKIKEKSLIDIMSSEELEKVINETRKTAANIISLKGGTVFAPGSSVGHMVEAIVKDHQDIIPMSVYLNGEYGVKNLCVGVPAILGKEGIKEIIEVELTNTEKEVFIKGVSTIKKAISDININ
jgi:malate dehydrogenase